MKLPDFMHGVQIIKYGPSQEALEYNTEIPLPTIKNPHQVLVKVKAAGVNPVEVKVTSGNIKGLSSAILSFPSIIGADFSGVIAEKGDQVNEFELGDEVFGSLPLPFGCDGTYAQYTLVDIRKSSIAKKPSNVSFEQAASAGIALLTAYQGVVNHGDITDRNKGQERSFLIVGASGGVGSYAIQVAKAINPNNYVVGICSGKNVEFVKSLGADRVIDYKNEEQYYKFLENRKGSFDFVFDCVGGDAYYEQLNPLLSKKGVYSTAVGPVEHFGSEPVGLMTGLNSMSKVIYRRFFASRTYKSVLSLPHDEFRSQIAPLFSQDIKFMVVNNDNIIPLKDAHIAHEKLLAHRVVGKIVLSVDQ
ncbi:hypothetical protein G6F56_001254 [Rhizopus delemar]|uniref:NADPh quinone reductase n=1 Tax=Rhizopus stolonifer TaxID=4846 RepID=A0A367JRT8_RHIST|nr:hypothetical protein G6F56_001254 [Rhizopus delemar]RCH92628.1 NADPh quinone reductase [Rhizopus stolonifer]